MPLILKVLAFKGQPATQATVIIDEQGGTIGRSDGNTLILPDTEKFVSRQHATINLQDGSYYLTDCSLSGVFIDSQEHPLHNSSQRLLDGMLLKIGDYEIVVSIDSSHIAQDFSFAKTKVAPQPDYFLALDDFADNPLLSEQSSAFVKHEDLIQATDEALQPGFESQLQGSSSVLFDSFVAPAVTTNPFTTEDIPEGFSFEDLLAESHHPQKIVARDTAATPLHEDAKPPTPSLPDNALFEAFLQGANLPYRSYQAEPLTRTLYRIGQMFRHLIMGTIAVLRNRTAFKSSLRLDMTMIQATDNNPLKFAVTADDVIRHFLEKNSEGFLGSVESIDQGFDDLIHHQLAMQVGIEAAIADLLEAFSPERIEKQIEQGIVLQKKAKCWDQYEEVYRYTSDTALENFFGEAFVEAYQQKMKQLSAKRHHHY